MATRVSDLLDAPLLRLAAAIVLGLLFVEFARELAEFIVALIDPPRTPLPDDAFPQTFRYRGGVLEYGGLLRSALAIALALGALQVVSRRTTRA